MSKHIQVLQMLWECAGDYDFGPRTVEALKAAITASSNQGEGAVYQQMATDVHVDDRGDEHTDDGNVWMDVSRETYDRLKGRPAIRSRILYLHPAEADRRDAERLDFMVHRGAVIDCSYDNDKRTVYRAMAFGQSLTGWRQSYREAIDAAIAATQEQT